MRSIKEIYVIGNGPSSSHSIGPYRAAIEIKNKYPDLQKVKVTLFGSLALTGKGHLTDVIINHVFQNLEHEIVFDYETITEHPNTMLFEITDKDNQKYQETILSIGGGTIKRPHEKVSEPDVYPHHLMSDIVNFCKQEKISLFDYVLKYEDKDILTYCKNVLKAMDDAVNRGISTDGELPGSLHVKRKAKQMFEGMHEHQLGEDDVAMNIAISAFAVAEENAAGGLIVTAPTCGSAGVLPGIIRYLRMKNINDDKIIEGLCVAGLFGMVCKTNASVSGAECGCQAEIGVASSMAAAMITYCFNKPIGDIVQAAEIALEHSLGLTCDPVDGYVQIPCIERCAVYANKAVNAFKLAILIPDDTIKVSYDDSVATMYQTGKDINSAYRETAKGGLAKQLKASKRGN